MADNLIRFRENQRYIIRGPISFDTLKRRFLIDMEPDEVKLITIDLNAILNGATITTDEVTKASGITASVSDSSGIITLTLSALSRLADITLKVTLSDSRVMKIYLRARSTENTYFDDYYWSVA